MFYRFRSRLATQDRLQAFVYGIPGTDKWAGFPHNTTYEHKFKPLSDPTRFSGVQLYQAPLFDPDMGITIYFNLDKEKERLPDIWGINNFLICSNYFKTTIDSFDDFEHEFIPISLLNSHEQIMITEKQYYWFNLRRFVQIPDLDKQCQLKTTPRKRIISETYDWINWFQAYEEEWLNHLMFRPMLDEALLLKSQAKKSIAESLDELPLWHYFSPDFFRNYDVCDYQTFYFSEALWVHLQAAQVTGMELFSEPYGKGEESVIGFTTDRGGV